MPGRSYCPEIPLNKLYYSLVPVGFLLSIYSSAVSCRTNNIGLSRGAGDTRFIEWCFLYFMSFRSLWSLPSQGFLVNFAFQPLGRWFSCQDLKRFQQICKSASIAGSQDSNLLLDCVVVNILKSVLDLDFTTSWRHSSFFSIFRNLKCLQGQFKIHDLACLC